MSTTKQRRSWLIPALVASFAFLGGVASDLVAADLQALLEPYRIWVWTLCGVALLVAIGAAIWDQRPAADGELPDMRRGHEMYTDLRRRYLARVAESVRYLPLSALDFKAASAETSAQERQPMADVYIALNTTTRVVGLEKKDATSNELQAGSEDQMLSALAALIKEPYLVLLGDPGGGKSTFVNHLAFCLASAELDRRQDWLARLPQWPPAWTQCLPLPIVLRDVAAWFQATQPPQRKTGLFEAYLAHWLATLGLGEFHATLCQHLRDGTAIVLLDGLDEVPLDDLVLKRIKEMIADLPSAYAQTHLLVTCRVLSYQDPRWQLEAKWPTFELDKLDESQIDQFIRTWHDQLAAMGVVKQAALLSAKLSHGVRQPDLWRLARNPLLLTVMAIVHTHDGELPDARVLLYQKVVELLLWRWEAKKVVDDNKQALSWRQLLQEAGLNDGDLQQALWALAFQVHGQLATVSSSPQASERSDEATADIGEFVLLSALHELHPDRSLNWARALVNVIKVRAGLLVESQPGIYRFPHRTFQEYLAGCHLSVQPHFTEQALALAGQGVFWWQVILLAVGRWVYEIKNIDPPLMLVNELCPPGVPAAEDVAGWRNIWLAGQCLLEIGLARAHRRSLGLTLVERVRGHLTDLITHDRLTPRERAEAGSVLSVMGDPRDLAAMIDVPAGEFTMGSSAADPYARDTEKPQHVVDVEAFQIGQYPVTNGQYAHFVAATGHESPAHWRGPMPPPDLLTHPVVNVSWYDAQVYCAWLSVQWGATVRLPTEAEWEKAARGEDGRIYPWPGDFAAANCNMAETGIDKTSPVGSFTAGASPYGLLDMAGNVWEWTSTKWLADYNDYASQVDNGLEGDDPRVLRGGAFNDNDQFVRCALRFRYYPRNWYYDFGFRVVVSPSTSGL